MLKKITSMAKKNAYSYFLLQCFIMLLIVWTIDFTTGNVLRIFYFKQYVGPDYRTTYSMENTTADILIFGSSRGARQYHPEVFENRLGMSYYNTSREGFFMFYHDAILKSALKRYTPKVIILDFRFGEFRKNKENYERLSSLLPYYKTHTEIQTILNQKSKHEKLKLLSEIYPFNSLLFKIATGNASFYKEKRSIIKGYIYYDEIWDKPIEKSKENKPYEMDSNIVKSYKSFITDCINRKIKLVVVVTPYFSITNTKADHSIMLAKEIAAKYHIKFIDYSQDTTLLNKPTLFADPIHLNDNGARVLSNMIADSIKNIK